MNDEFRQRMEGTLRQYEKSFDPNEPVVCLDEQPYQMVEDARPPEPAAPGKIAKQDYEYRRGGTCSVFVAVEPKAGKRFTQARHRRTRADFARFVRDLLKRYPDAERVHLVLDNLNTHNDKSLIRTFGEAAARPLLNRIEWHYTPKHASWLNMAEIEIGVLARQCLNTRFKTRDILERHVQDWKQRRNRQRRTIEWTFTRQVADAKLARHYVS